MPCPKLDETLTGSRLRRKALNLIHQQHGQPENAFREQFYTIYRFGKCGEPGHTSPSCDSVHVRQHFGAL